MRFNATCNFSGRGMELSDLLLFKKRLYSVDDKTGIVFELVNGQAAPWAILGIGDGKQNKGKSKSFEKFCPDDFTFMAKLFNVCI